MVFELKIQTSFVIIYQKMLHLVLIYILFNKQHILPPLQPKHRCVVADWWNKFLTIQNLTPIRNDRAINFEGTIFYHAIFYDILRYFTMRPCPMRELKSNFRADQKGSKFTTWHSDAFFLHVSPKKTYVCDNSTQNIILGSILGCHGSIIYS